VDGLHREAPAAADMEARLELALAAGTVADLHRLGPHLVPVAEEEEVDPLAAHEGRDRATDRNPAEDHRLAPLEMADVKPEAVGRRGRRLGGGGDGQHDEQRKKEWGAAAHGPCIVPDRAAGQATRRRRTARTGITNRTALIASRTAR
jgi:hypothetical protein